MLGGTVINIEILVGLPGSGKTYYSDNKLSEYSNYHKAKYFGEGPKNKRQMYALKLDFDKYKGQVQYPKLETILDFNGYKNIFLFHPESLVICDGLFLTNDVQEKLVKEWVELFNKEGGGDNTNKLNIKFVYFKENREGCLSNDSYREKERQAVVTIKHHPFEKPDIESLKEIFNQENINFEIEEREVHVMNKYEGEFKSLRDNYWSDKKGKDVMVSDRWLIGGTCADYEGNCRNIGPDKAPVSFEKLDNLLENYCPHITFLHYKKICNNCVTVEEDQESDYYGGTEYFNFYCCDLRKLYEMLKDFDYIDED